MKIVMYGSGAAGSVFASYLKRGGADMILIDRYEAHMNAVNENGMKFTIHENDGTGEYKDRIEQLLGFRAYTSSEAAAEAEGKVDAIIYMTKATQLESALNDSLPLIGKDTVGISLINGIGNDDYMFKVFEKDHTVIGSGVIGTRLDAPGACTAIPAGGVMMNFGATERSARSDEVCQAVYDYFHAGECNAMWRKDDIYQAVWTKVCVNCTANTCCATLRLKINEIDADPYGRALNHQVIREVCAIATARGIPMDADEFIANQWQEIIDTTGDYYTSMGQDVFMHHRQTEIDVLNGKISEYGKQYGIPTPANDTLSMIIRCVQNNYDKQYS